MKTGIFSKQLTFVAGALCAGLAFAANAQEQTEPMQQTTEVPAPEVEATPSVETEAKMPVEKRPLVWAEYINEPDVQEMTAIAMSLPMIQDNAEITVISPPEKFDGAAYVMIDGVAGVYLIKNESTKDTALEFGKSIEGSIREKLNLEAQETEASNAAYASTFISKEIGDLKLVNVIVGEDGFGSHTVTVAFSY